MGWTKVDTECLWLNVLAKGAVRPQWTHPLLTILYINSEFNILRLKIKEKKKEVCHDL